MARAHRRHSVEFKRQVVQEYLSGEESLHGLAKHHDVCRNLIRVWIEKDEAGAFDEDQEAASLLQDYQAKIAALERKVGQLTMELDLLKKGATLREPAEKREFLDRQRPKACSVSEGCRSMRLARH
jgi:transposase